MLAPVLLFLASPWAKADDADRGPAPAPPPIIEEPAAPPEAPPTKEEMAKFADEAWLPLKTHPISDSLKKLSDSQKASLAALKAALTDEEKTKYKDVLDRADKFANTIVPEGYAAVQGIFHDIASWDVTLKKGQPRIAQVAVDRVRENLSKFQAATKKYECFYYGHARQHCQEYVEDEYNAFLSYDGKIKELILALSKRVPEKADEWKKVGEDLSLGTYRTALDKTEEILSHQKEASEALQAYASKWHLIDLSTSTTNAIH